MHNAPIALFVYNRPWHTRQTVEALLKNPEAINSELIVYSDGPRTSEVIELVKEVRGYIASVNGFKNVRLIARENNLGLARSIISGVSEVLAQYSRVIVLEDDLVTSLSFLAFMNKALDTYENKKEVISITGYIYPINNLPSTFFLRGADCWGWATWRRGWELFNPDGTDLLHQLETQNLSYRFDFNGSYPYTQMLRDQISAKNDSWAIRWYASAFLQNKLTLYPCQSLIQNIGADGSGTHVGISESYKVQLPSSPVNLENIPVAEHEEAFLIISDYFKILHSGSAQQPQSVKYPILQRLLNFFQVEQ